MKLYSFEHSKLEYSRKGNIATLNRPITIYLDTNEGEYTINVKNGFRWNGNSGCFPCRFSKDNEDYNVIILVHDVLYHRVGLSKADADDILRGGLRECGYGRAMAGLVHKAVELFGRCAYNEDDEMTIANLPLIEVYLESERLHPPK